MTIKLKDFDRAVSKITRKIKRKLNSKSLKQELAEVTIKDIKEKMSAGRMPNLKGGTKSAPRLTKKTKAVYRQAGIPEKPRFEFTSDLKNSIAFKFIQNGVKIFAGKDGLNEKKVRWLQSSESKNKNRKKRRIIFGWTKVRTNKLKKVLKNFIKTNFK